MLLTKGLELERGLGKYGQILKHVCFPSRRIYHTKGRTNSAAHSFVKEGVQHVTARIWINCILENIRDIVSSETPFLTI
jgi:hypothetical protein